MLSTLQSLLNELSNDIKNMIDKAFKLMENIIWKTNEEEALFRLEQCNIYLSHYANITKASNSLNRAMDLLGLEHSLVGKLNNYNIYFILKLNISRGIGKED